MALLSCSSMFPSCCSFPIMEGLIWFQNVWCIYEQTLFVHFHERKVKEVNYIHLRIGHLLTRLFWLAAGTFDLFVVVLNSDQIQISCCAAPRPRVSRTISRTLEQPYRRSLVSLFEWENHMSLPAFKASFLITRLNERYDNLWLCARLLPAQSQRRGLRLISPLYSFRCDGGRVSERVTSPAASQILHSLSLLHGYALVWWQWTAHLVKLW